jgi:hypothetical protein
MTLKPIRKYATEIRTLSVSFADKLMAGESLLPGVTVSVDDAGLTAAVLGITASAVTVRITGGTLGQTYVVSTRAGTSDGNLLEVSRDIEVSDDAN